MRPRDQETPELFGRRVAALRAQRGWSQANLAERLAMSRTAVSHLEAGMRQAGERTVVLLAGLFRVEPHALTAGTDFPPAKAERLPLTAARYTEAELQCALARHDLNRLTAREGGTRDRGAGEAELVRWLSQLRELAGTTHDHNDLAVIEETISALRNALTG